MHRSDQKISQGISTNGHGKEYLDIVQDNYLWQHVDQATRGENILDLVRYLKSGTHGWNPCTISQILVGMGCDISDSFRHYESNLQPVLSQVHALTESQYSKVNFLSKEITCHQLLTARINL